MAASRAISCSWGVSEADPSSLANDALWPVARSSLRALVAHGRASMRLEGSERGGELDLRFGGGVRVAAVRRS